MHSGYYCSLNLEKTMNPFRRIGTYFLLCTLGYLLHPLPAFPRTAPVAAQTGAQRDGQHDFDFNIGTWKTHIRYLHQQPTGLTWVELDGTVVVRKVRDGRGQLEEIEADGSTGHFEGLTLFLYNPQSHQWSQNFANSNNGTIATPAIGEFKNGRGEFLSQQPYHGKTVLIRSVWSDITPNSHRFSSSYSDDGGKTWEPNFIATLTREK
jgi:hypothetical protein